MKTSSTQKMDESQFLPFFSTATKKEAQPPFKDCLLKMPYESKMAVMKGLGTRYRQAKVNVDLYDDGIYPYMRKEIYNNYRNLIFIINRILQEFDREYRMIIRKTFFEGQEDPLWYKGFYSSPTFKRHLQKAVDDFIEKMDYFRL